VRNLLFSVAMIALAGSAWAQDTMKATVVAPEALTWKDNPAIPKGGQFAILIGDPTKAGDVVVQRVKFPANYQVPPHTHPDAETVTVISGSVGFGMGEKFEKKGEMVKAGALCFGGL
jgi:quercetin dioxygenase-like cupin family protein